MAKKNHHFVPQFYLRAFSNDGRRIHVYNLKHRKPIQHASLRHQCFRHHLHGKTDDLETALSEVENVLAPLVRAVIDTSSLPPENSPDYVHLLLFVALQMVRTTRSAEKSELGIDKMFKQTLRHDPDFKDVDMASFSVRSENPVVGHLTLLLEPAIKSILDLSMYIICAGPNQTFITSDNPVFKYNQYMQGVKGLGVTGHITRGLQIFVPLSPKHLLLLTDSSIYRINSHKNSRMVFKLPDSDITKLNMMQIHSAEENLYFSDWSQEPYVQSLVSRAIQHRIEDPIRVEEFFDTEDERHSLIAQYEQMPNLQLRTSFMRVHDFANRIKLQERISNPKIRYRFNPAAVLPPESRPTPPLGYRGRDSVTFVRRPEPIKGQKSKPPKRNDS
jgi:hypothetical protein